MRRIKNTNECLREQMKERSRQHPGHISLLLRIAFLSRRRDVLPLFSWQLHYFVAENVSSKAEYPHGMLPGRS